MFTEIEACRICKCTSLELLFDLGSQVLTGVFPKTKDEEVEAMPVQLVRCADPQGCGLVQLRHSGAPEMMYGDRYGYRSGLNRWMVSHLEGIVQSVTQRVSLSRGDTVVDIGSNDATLLKFYETAGLRRIGIDPTGSHFRQYYPDDVTLVPTFFSAQAAQFALAGAKAKVVTSIAMFYDLEDPQSFVNDIASVLSEDGIWVSEQSYLPLMLERNAYDTICHEHLEYYGLRQLEWLCERAGLVILHAELNDANGGSIRLFACKKTFPGFVESPNVGVLRERERALHLNTPAPYMAFRERVLTHREQLLAQLADLRRQGKVVFGLGASTKGNVLLQFCHITPDIVPCIAEVNPEKFGCFTPGTLIPILSQDEADAKCPDVYLVLPWHFRSTIIERSQEFLSSGGQLLFPLPLADIVHSS